MILPCEYKGSSMDVFEVRRSQAVEGMSIPASANNGDSWAPFTSPGYSWGNIGDLSSEYWTELRLKGAEALVPLNPYTSCDPGVDVWKAAIAIPACKWRTLITDRQRPPNSRDVNLGFGVHTLPALLKSGPVQGGWRRPRSPYILDLVSYKRGFELFELAHVMALAHFLRVPESARLFELVRLWLAKIAVSLRYRLPVFEDWESPFRFKSNGFRVVAGMYPDKPWFPVPVSGCGSLEPFKDVGCIFVAIGIEGLPSGFRDGSLRWTPATRWCCGSNQAVITGWEFSDVVTHMPVNTVKGVYSLCWQDIQDAATFDSVIEAAPKPSSGYSVEELLSSDFYAKLRLNTPPLPIKECLAFRSDDTVGLTRPMLKRPEGKLNPKLRDHMAWIAWDSGTDSITEMIKKATVFYDNGRRLKLGLPTIPRKGRLARYNKLKAKAVKLKKLKDSIPKLAREGWLKEARDATEESEAIIKELEILG